MIVPLNLPKAKLSLKRKQDKVYVFSILRKKDLLLTPEEWVRQHLVHQLIYHYGFPAGRIAEEFSLEYNGRSKRADLVLYNTNGKPVMIIETKAPEVEISEETLFQIAQYNAVLQVEYLMLSNGITHYIARISSDGSIEYLKDFPDLTEKV